MRVTAILLMGGKGLRFEREVPKQFLNLIGKKIYLHTLETFLSFPEFFQILLVCHKDWVQCVSNEVRDSRIHVIEGGETRQDSSYRGLIACKKGASHVVIHDSVRPLVSKKIIRDNLNALQKHDAVNTCIPSTDTIVHTEDFHHVASIPNRRQYLRGQTPQSFSYPLILKAHERASFKHSSDDCSLVSHLGHEIHIVSGSENNIKITQELDLFLAEQLMRLKRTICQPSSYSLEGKVYAITGGTGGIGSAVSQLLVEEGAYPLIISRSSPTFGVDLTHYEQVHSLFDTIYKKYGCIDGLINCVGFLFLKRFLTLAPEEIDYILTTNLFPLIYSCHCARVKEGGHIINLASSSFSHGREQYILYSCAKAAIVNFTQGLAKECPHFYVNAIIPQRTATSMRGNNFSQEGLSSLLSPMEVAQEVLSLLKQREVTGSLIEVRKREKGAFSI